MKSVKDEPAVDDGLRVLVDRSWPGRLTKEQARVQLWMRDIAPCKALKAKLTADSIRWEEFEQQYRAELGARLHLVRQLLRELRKNNVTLLHSGRNLARYPASVLKDYLVDHCKGARLKKKSDAVIF